MFSHNLFLCSFSKEFPVNIRFCLEGMEESGSEGLDELIFAQRDAFFKDVDYVCISDNYWLGKKKPCITYGLRGICYYFIEVSAGIHCIVKLNFSLEKSGDANLFIPLAFFSRKDEKNGYFCGMVFPNCLNILLFLSYLILGWVG